MKIRIGNDFVFNWAIERNGLPENLSSVLEKHLHLSVFGKKVELVEGVDYDITGNVIRIEVTPAIANIIGTYKVEFRYILPDNGLIDEDRKCAVDVDAFQIVAKTAQADDSTEFSMTSDMAIAFKGDKGDSAYQVWLDAGNIGTEEDYFVYLRQPAVDAAQSANEATLEAQTATQEATTAASLADTARLAIQDDLAIKANQADLAQLESDVNELGIKDAVQGAKIKDIENVLSTANLNQSAQLSVSGVSPLLLPKNAANGGMQMKLEGLTEDVGGVITHFVPTGRVRSVGGEIPLSYEVGAFNTAGGPISSSSTIRTPNFITVNENQKYVLISKNPLFINGGVFYFKADDTFISRKVFTEFSSLENSRLIINPPAGCAKIKLTFKKEDGSNIFPSEVIGENIYSLYSNSTSLYLTAPELRSNGTVKDEIRKGVNGYELVKRISDVDGTVLATPVISPISYGGVLNSAENGTVYHEPIIADAGVYDTKIDVLLTDYPISAIEEAIKYENGINTYLDVNKAVIASDGLSFTHPDLVDGDLVLFTYAYSKESTSGNITASFYDSNVVKIDTVTGKAYRINEVVTNGVLTRTLTEV